MTSSALLESRRVYSAVQKDYATFLELASENGRTVIEVELAAGGGNAPHIHATYDEYFEVLEGTLTVRLGRRELEVRAGEAAIAPRGSVHCFSNATDSTVRFRVELGPGHRGFEEALQVGYGLATDGRTLADGTPKNPLVLALLFEWAELIPVGPERMIVPIMRPLARLARRRGIDAELRARYVRF
jgi:quercetin dioxygenase-like cupin family protein